MPVRRLLPALLAGVVVTIAGTGYALGERHGDRPASRTDAPSEVAPSRPSAHPTLTGPHLVFRHTGLDAQYGVVAEVPLEDPTGPRTFTGVSCDRVYAVASAASCLRTLRGVETTYEQVDLDADWNQTARMEVPGIPSRTRLSTDGRLAASTTFVSAHSYMTTGFSTATEIHHVGPTAGDRSFGNLEDFILFVHGARTDPDDLNVWGVTFADDDNTFYVTVATGGRTYLARGDLALRTLTTIGDRVECPALSPDGTRLAFKQKVAHAGGTWWTPAVLDLTTMRRTVLRGERRNVDDQIAWLDDHTLLYGLPRPDQPGVTDVWSLRTSPRARPRTYVAEAWSPAVVR